jgi:hypothetical protein
MNGKTAAVLLSGLLFACTPQPPAPPPPPPPPVPAPAAAPPPAARWVAIRTADCAALLSLSEEDRTAASVFYLGYQASRMGARAINKSAIPSMERLAILYCEAYPKRPVAEAFAHAYAASGRAGVRR